MFQNIDVEYAEEEIEVEENIKSNNKIDIIKKIFSIQNILLYIVSLGVSMAGIGTGISPFGLAIFGSACSNKMPAGMVFLMAGIGTFIKFGQEGILTYLLTVLVFVMFALIYKPKYENVIRNEKRKLGVHLTFATFLVQIVGIAFKTFYVYDFITSMLFTIMVYIFYKIFTNSITVIKDWGDKKAFTIEEVIGASLLISIAITVFGDFTVAGLSIRNILCILIVLILGWKNGILVGTTGGVTIGVVLGIIGKGDPMFVGAFALSGMIAGILNHFGKIGVALGFVIGNTVLTYVSTGNTVQIIYFREILIASLGLILIPKSIEINISDLIGKTKLLPYAKERRLEENEDTIYKLNSVSTTIQDISESYYMANEGKEQIIDQETFIDELLENIEEMQNSIVYDDIVNMENNIAQDIYTKLQEKEEIYMQDLLDIFAVHNSYIVGLDSKDIGKTIEKDIMQVVKLINHTYRISCLNFVWKHKLEEKSKTISNQLEGVSKVISKVAEDITHKNTNTKYEKHKEEIEILLLQKNIGIYDINIKEEKNGKVIVDLYTKVCEDITEEIDKIQKTESILSKILNMRMTLQKQKNGINNDETKVLQTYISEDKYTLNVGMASTIKQNSEMSGDTFLKTKLDDGKMLLALSDGMGSGKDARKSSELAIKMVKNLLGAGFDKKVAIELINSMLVANQESETFATLDISILDLFAGNVEFIKNGACPSYIKRGKEVEIINAISLPTGILTNVDSVIFDKDLCKDDILVMCTDGIIEANKEAIIKEEWIKELLQDISTDNVQKIADIIRKEAIDHGFGIAKDDMTIIVAKVN